MPKRKSKKHKRVKRVKQTNKPKTSLHLAIPSNSSNLIVELMAIVCPKHDYTNLLTTRILFGKMVTGEITHYCDHNIDSRKISYFSTITSITVAWVCGSKQTLKPSYLAGSLFNSSLYPQHRNYIDKCVEWCMDFFQSTQRPLHYPNACNQIHVTHFQEPYTKYLQTKSKDLKQQILHYLTLIGELFNHNIISHTFIYDKILNSSVSRQYVNKPLETIQIEILYHLCKICGEKLYEESNNKLMELIYSDYECEICLELVHVKLLPIPCGHVLCTDCMKSGFDLFDGKCPVCG
eukprot:228618_1